LPTGSVIVSANLSLYITSTQFDDGAPQTGMSVCKPANGYPSRPSVSADMDRTRIGATLASITSFTNNAYNAFTIPTTSITPAAWNAFYTRMKGDIDNTSPGTATKLNHVSPYLGTATSQTHRPRLVVTYYAPWAPTFTSSPATTGTKNILYSYHITLNETGTITYQGAPAWLSISNSKNGTTGPWYLNGTPTVSGVYSIHLKGYSNSGALDSYQNYSLTIANTWAPTFTSSPAMTGVTGIAYYYNATANETSTFASISKPAWASFSTSKYTGSPTLIGVYAFHLQATSTAGTLTANQYWNVTVADTWAPTLNSITPYGSSNSSYANWVVGDDFDTRLIYNESCHYILDTNASFLSAGGDNGTDTFDVINISTLVQGSYYAHIEATSDDGTLARWTNWTFDVWPAIIPDTWAPTFTSLPPLTGIVGTNYEYDITLNESSVIEIEDVPYWLDLYDVGSTTADLMGTPDTAGSYNVSIKATSDGGGLVTYQNWTVVVSDPIIPPVDPSLSDTTNLLVSLLTVLLMIALLVAMLKGIKRW
jgi:hypothetical protein